MQKLKTIFMGTPDFSLPSLDLLLNHPLIDLKHIITMPDRPAGRGKKLVSPPVAEFATLNKITLIQTENINKEIEILENLDNEKIDLIIVLAFAQFLGKKVLNIPKIGAFNIHTSLLPKYRGAAPIQYALLNGDKSTGVSIQRMVKQMDAGDLCISSTVKISENETGGQLYTRLKFQAALSLNEFVDQLHSSSISYTKQNEVDATFAPTLKKEDGELNFSSQTYTQISNRIHALDPWPGTFTFLNGKRLKVFKIEKYNKVLKPAEYSTEYGQLIIGIKDCSIRLTEVQLEGKKRCLDTELLNGFQNRESEIQLGPKDN